MKNKILIIFVTLCLIVSVVCINTNALTPTYTVSDSYKKSVYYTNLCNVKLTGNYITDICNVALSQKDYHEGSSKTDLSGNSTGKGDYTEYGNWYGLHTAWCAMFISWCARQARIPTNIISNNIRASGSITRFGEKQYSFSSHIPQAGDFVYVDNDSDPDADHVGLVYNVDKDYIYTIEGNTSYKVYAIKYHRSTGVQTYYSSTKIVFYGVPSYGNSSPTSTKSTVNTVSTTSTTKTTTKPTTTPSTTKPTTTTSTQSTTKSSIILGDVNGDKSVNSNDALLVLNHSVNIKPLTKEQIKIADVNNDGFCNGSDALAILNISTNKK